MNILEILDLKYTQFTAQTDELSALKKTAQRESAAAKAFLEKTKGTGLEPVLEKRAQRDMQVEMQYARGYGKAAGIRRILARRGVKPDGIRTRLASTGFLLKRKK